jgi:uncharacterized protein (TIGR00288 family)
LAPWWLRTGSDEEDAFEDDAPGVGDDATDDDGTDDDDMSAAAAAPAADDSGRGSPRDDEEPDEADSETLEEAGEEAGSKRRKRRRRRKRRKPATEPAPPADQELPAPAAPAPRPRPAAPAAAPAPPEPPMASATQDLEPGYGFDPRHMVYPLPPERSSSSDERKIAVFCDFENIALGVRDSEIKKLDINLILERLIEKGKIIVKKAYADWERYNEYKKPFHEAAIELIDIPQKYYSGKNSADIKMVVDAMDLCYSKEHLDTFVLVSGDSDFSPLVSKLKENDKHVIGVGVKNSSSSLLIDNCDEFIYYEDLWRDDQRAERLDNLSPKDAEVFGLMLDAMFALNRENKDVLWGSMIKQTMKRKRPSFNEGYYGYRTFSELLEDAQRKNIIRLKRDQRSGNYVVTGLAKRR